MKTLILLALCALPTFAHASTEQVFCGEGKESGTIAGSQLALTLTDGVAKLYFQGEDNSSHFTFSQTDEGTLAAAVDKGGPTIVFGRCDASNTTAAHFVGGEVSNQPFLCNCTQN